MLHIGENLIDGVPVKVERKRVRRISMRIGLDGVVNLNVPKWGSSLRSAESFMRSKWKWIGKIRSEMASRAPENKTPVTGEEKAELLILLDVLNTKWAEKLNEGGVVWSVRKMSSLWGVVPCPKKTHNVQP
jgi:predicted metal-dependent hydrolase